MISDLKTLTILRGLLKDDVFARFAECQYNDVENFYAFVHAFYSRKNFREAGLNFGKYVENLICFDENIFSETIAARKRSDPIIEKAYKRDIEIIYDAIRSIDPKGFYSTEIDYGVDNKFAELYKKYSSQGYGRYLKSYALKFDNNELVPVENAKHIELSELIGYESQKAEIKNNIENFLNGLPFSDMLLYGDMGTGKSSTVLAMAYKFYDRKIRLIELPAANISSIPAIRKITEDVPMKFLIFIDDIALETADSALASLKTNIEGTAAYSPNTMIIATSNRRHIVKESFAERENAVHENDVIQENLSLSDRFGITIFFHPTDKSEYLSIVKQLAENMNLKTPTSELCDKAEKWAIEKGGRSPRRAKQFIDVMIASEINESRKNSQ